MAASTALSSPSSSSKNLLPTTSPSLPSLQPYPLIRARSFISLPPLSASIAGASDSPDGFVPPNIQPTPSSTSVLLPLLSSPSVLLPLLGTVFGAVCQVTPVRITIVTTPGLHRDLPGGVPCSLWPQRHTDWGLLFGFVPLPIFPALSLYFCSNVCALHARLPCLWLPCLLHPTHPRLHCRIHSRFCRLSPGNRRFLPLPSNSFFSSTIITVLNRLALPPTCQLRHLFF